MSTRDDMLAKLTELSVKVADEAAQEKAALASSAEVLAASTEVISGLKAKVAALELAALPAADFSDELAQIAAIEASISSIIPPAPVVPPVAPPAPVVPPVVPPVAVVPPVDPIVPPVVLPVV